MFMAIDEVTNVATKNDVSDKEQYAFCITGQREPYKSMIEKAGHKITGSVSKKTKAVICIPQEEKKSSKILKAEELNIEIINTQNRLEELLEELK